MVKLRPINVDRPRALPLLQHIMFLWLEEQPLHSSLLVGTPNQLAISGPLVGLFIEGFSTLYCLSLRAQHGVYSYDLKRCSCKADKPW